MIVRVDIRGPDMTAARRSLAAQQVWERCRDSTSVPLRHAALGDLGDGLFAGTVRPALTEHDRLRLTSRTGTMAAAYLVETGQESPAAAVRRNLAVGPPSIEQIYYGLHLEHSEADQPPPAIVAVSRLVDAPRRMMTWF
ncbi:hypothetical protein ABZ464_00225 [Streptomyces sp. NPDC005820]|uniref:hypothetical protein n=1 Tax=Streptomyces sp. NPDC005820 TaxID=3157069 RepID=UPI00340A6B75